MFDIRKNGTISAKKSGNIWQKVFLQHEDLKEFIDICNLGDSRRNPFPAVQDTISEFHIFLHRNFEVLVTVTEIPNLA